MSVTNKQKVAVGGGRRTNQKLGARGKRGGWKQEKRGSVDCCASERFYFTCDCASVHLRGFFFRGIQHHHDDNNTTRADGAETYTTTHEQI